MQYLEIVKYLIDELDYDQSMVAGSGNTVLAGTTDTKVRQMANAVNRAYRHLWLELGPLNEGAEYVTAFSTVSGQESYPLPPVLKSVDEINIAKDPPLRMVPWPEYERQFRGSVGVINHAPTYYTGYPIVGTIYAGSLYFYPRPDNAYTVNIRGKRLFTVLINDSDVPLIPTDGHHVLMEWALYFLMLYEGNPASNGQKQIAEEALKQLKGLSRAHMDIPPRLVSEDEIAEQDASQRLNLFY